MQITSQILSIPPYLSTTWSNIATLKSEVDGKTYTLIITLKSDDQVRIPSLVEADVNTIFEAYAKYVPVPSQIQASPGFPVPFSFSLPLLQQEGPVSSLGESMRHNPEQANLPDIPVEVLGKVAMIAKAFGFDDFSNLEQSEESCNCVYCQLKRAFTPVDTIEEKIEDADLVFRDWEVKEVSSQLYSVTSPLDENEQYNVFLGEPLGCTCGHKNCEHIKAVLHS